MAKVRVGVQVGGQSTAYHFEDMGRPLVTVDNKDDGGVVVTGADGRYITHLSGVSQVLHFLAVHKATVLWTKEI